MEYISIKYPTRWLQLSLFLVFVFSISTCNDLLTTKEQKVKQEISKIDGKPIVNLDARKFYEGDWFEKKVTHLADKYGLAIVRGLYERAALVTDESDNFAELISPQIPVKNLDKYIQQDNITSSSPHIGSGIATKK